MALRRKPPYIPIMRIAIVKGQGRDHLSVTRGDGSRADTSFAHKGPFPHDAMHFAVEAAMGFASGFWGMVERGEHPEAIGEKAKAAGHASAKRATTPDAEIVELLQAERLVECFEADLWSGGTGDPALLRATAATACAASFVPMPDLSDGRIAAIRSATASMAADWQKGRLDLEWTAPA